MTITYISWAPHCSRSDHTARELGGTSHMVYWGRLGSHSATVVLKYIGQSFSTWRVLLRERPDAVFVMTPPPIAIIPVYLYCLLRGAGYVIDSHSGVFMTRRWRHFIGMQLWFSRRALTTIVTNEYLAGLVRSRGGHATIVPDVPIRFEAPTTAPSAGFTAVCVTSFDKDEPIDAMIEAARRLPHIRFLMTGKAAKAAEALLRDLPANLTLTGFLDNVKYGTLLATAGVVIALTREEYTMQRAAYEAIYQGTPVIVSDTPVLREAFDDGSVLVDNTPEAIANAVKAVYGAPTAYRDGARRLRARKLDRWQKTKLGLIETLRAGRKRPDQPSIGPYSESQSPR